MRHEVRLRSVEPTDLAIFYEQQLDADATRMAAFPARRVLEKCGFILEREELVATASTDVAELVFVLR